MTAGDFSFTFAVEHVDYFFWVGKTIFLAAMSQSKARPLTDSRWVDQGCALNTDKRECYVIQTSIRVIAGGGGRRGERTFNPLGARLGSNRIQIMSPTYVMIRPTFPIFA